MLSSDKAKEETQLQDTPHPQYDYGSILSNQGLAYKPVEYYLQVGEISQVQGWIIHVAIIMPQVEELLSAVVPFLKDAGVPFKIPADRYMADGLLAGACGYNKVAKIVCVYPENDDQALMLVNGLIRCTKDFKAPEIPTDAHLGGCVYTRYGAFNPVVSAGADGSMHNYIYDKEGNLAEDLYSIPFTMPVGIIWPFSSITALPKVKAAKLLNDRIKILDVIKPDVKGDVIKGLYMKGWFRVKNCIVKEGKAFMFMDKWGRDIQDRLEWQRKLHQELYQLAPVPKILDYFKEGNRLYLAMEYIEGVRLDDWIYAVFEGEHWGALPVSKRVKLVKQLLAVVQIVNTLHKHGYVHRDLSPYNFIIDKNDKTHIIDLELTYSFVQQIPAPAFKGGTEGFMSPEQVAHQEPTVKEDIYGLGALMILFFTNLSPLKFNVWSIEELNGQLAFFITEGAIRELITACLHLAPQERPGLADIEKSINALHAYMLRAAPQSNIAHTIGIDINIVLRRALKGICSEKLTYDGVWFSKAEQKFALANQQQAVTVYPGLYQGIAGVLWTLRTIKNNGFILGSDTEEYYCKNYQFLQDEYLPTVQNLPAGLYTGAAGIALMLAAGMEDSKQEERVLKIRLMQRCLESEPAGLDLMNGASGQGLALLRCMPYMPEEFAQNRLQESVSLLLTEQQSDGAWVSLTAGTQKKVKLTGLTGGVSGITLFLLQLFARLNIEPAAYAAMKALGWLEKQAYKNNGQYAWPVHTLDRQPNAWVYNGGAGIALTFIRAYEVLQDVKYKDIACRALNSYPAHISDRDQSYAGGMAGLGEVYLEAARVFGEEQWLERAHWIAACLQHLQKRDDEDIGYWLPDALCGLPTADLMIGNSGIIHFLARCQSPHKLGFPLL